MDQNRLLIEQNNQIMDHNRKLMEKNSQILMQIQSGQLQNQVQFQPISQPMPVFHPQPYMGGPLPSNSYMGSGSGGTFVGGYQPYSTISPHQPFQSQPQTIPTLSAPIRPPTSGLINPISPSTFPLGPQPIGVNLGGPNRDFLGSPFPPQPKPAEQKDLGPTQFPRLSPAVEAQIAKYGRFKGSKVNGEFEGIPNKGPIQYEMGEGRVKGVYEGQIKDGVAHGFGLFIEESGKFLLEGFWRNGLQDGEGVRISSDFSHCAGFFKDGNPKSVTEHISDKDDGAHVYEGDYKKNLLGVMQRDPEKGVATFPDGSKYVGDWALTYKHGKGTITYIDGSTDSGTWNYDKKHGLIVHTDKDGKKTEQKWEKGQLVTK